MLAIILTVFFHQNIMAKTPVNTFEKPDFAYPKTVIKNAEQVLRNAKDDNTRMLAAIQMVIADGQIDGTKPQHQFALLDSVGALMSPPYSNLMSTLEAQFLSDVYSSDSWQFDQRKLPLTPLPADITEWSGDQFRNAIYDLAEKAMRDSRSMDETPISTIAPLLTCDEKGYDKFVPTVGAFVRMQLMTDILGQFVSRNTSIPFYTTDNNNVSEKLASLSNSIYNELTSPAFPEDTRIFVRGIYRADNSEALLKSYEELKSSPASLFLLQQAYVNNRDDSRKDMTRWYSLMQEALRLHPDSRFADNLRSMVQDMESEETDFTTDEQMLSTRPVKVLLKTKNVKKGYILVIRIPETPENPTLKQILSTGRTVSSTPFEFDNTVPFYAADTLTVRNPGYGRYVLVVSRTPDTKGIVNKSDYYDRAVFRVSDLQFATSSNDVEAKNNNLYVTDGRNFGPIAGQEVTFRENRKSKSKTETTDKQGAAPLPEGYFTATAQRGKDINSEQVSNRLRAESKESDTSFRGQVLTDLSIYHPGDTVRFTAIVMRYKDRRLASASGSEVKALLYDANGKERDKANLRTDGDGRISGFFILPKDGLLGNWRITLRKSEEYLSAGSSYFEVAEYKAPVIFAEISDITIPDNDKGNVEITGRVMTYSGMPVADAKVDYTIRYNGWWRWYNNSGASYGNTVGTDGQGNFKITLPCENLKDTPFARGGYSVKVTATSPSGDTAESPSRGFALGKAERISTARIPSKYKIETDAVTLKIPVLDILDKPVTRQVNYTLKCDGRNVASGQFTSPTLSLSAKNLASGDYTVLLSLPGDSTDNNAEGKFTLYRADDRKVPSKTALWLPENTYTAKKGAESVEVKVGTAYPGQYILYQISDCEKVLETNWLKGTGDVTTIKVPAPADNERIRVTFIGSHDLIPVQGNVTVVPAEADNKLEIEVVSFRDRITPGSEETWQFRFLYNGKEAPSLPVMAVMTDKALNAIAPFAWVLNPRGSIYYPTVGRLYTDYPGNVRGSQLFAPQKSIKYFMPQTPEWQTYGKPLYQMFADYGMVLYDCVQVSEEKAEAPRPRMMKSRATMKSANAMAAPEAAEKEAADDTAESLAGSAAGIGVEGSATQNIDTAGIELQDAEHPLAFFKPNLSTDKNGVVTLSFTSPNYNTTWQLQLAGYTPEMYTDVKKFDAVSAKPVMVKGNFPRFLRTGDSVNLTATLMNNTDETRPVAGVLELFNPADGTVVKRLEFKGEEMTGKGSRTVAIPYTVPDDISQLGIRAYAVGDRYKDGEQDIIAILPATSPVFESTDFYLGVDRNTFTTKLPKYDKNANVTLHFCDNPVWLCVTALPDLNTGKSNSIFSQLNSLFGNALAAHTVDKYPRVQQAISWWTDQLKQGRDSTLVSNLEKNQNLKNVALINTPWVNDAESQSRRMQNLVNLLDRDACAAAVKENTQQLLKVQKADGGWGWVPDMKSSVFTTSAVLLNLAMLRDMGCMPAGFEQAVPRAIKFCDAEIYDNYLKSKKRISTVSALSWLYIRSFFTETATDANFASYKKKALAQIEKGWRDLSIYDKATAAILLSREGRKTTAFAILESLRQNASVKDDGAMYFANLKGVFTGFNPLITTTQVLEAFIELAPHDKDVDRLRQWLIEQKQAQDWGYDHHTAEIIYTILSSGIDWTEPQTASTLRIGDLDFTGKGNPYTGEITAQLDLKAVSGKTLTVNVNGNRPAWGGVLAQYVLPSDRVKSAAVERLSIEKTIYALDDTPAGTIVDAKELTSGQKIRVVLTVKNPEDLQFISITDQRGACMEPVEQLSSYYLTDGIFTYREVRDAVTSLFVEYLPKGTHQFSYDCIVTQTGDFSVGIATAQSLYAPVIVAHSAGKTLVSNKNNNSFTELTK